MRRTRALPAGWYPSNAEDVRAQVRSWDEAFSAPRGTYVAVVVPHAGWGFSGRIAFRTLRELRSPVDTVVVVGGHLRPGDPVLIAPEDEYETPLGELFRDAALGDHLTRSLAAEPDRIADNTVEVQLPLVRHLFADARLVYLRCPPGAAAIHAGRLIAEYALENRREIRVVGSTDLTHYGPSYGFSPAGRGANAVVWVRDENDRSIVDAMRAMDADETLRLGRERRAACSSGAAAAAISFARMLGSSAGELVEYGQSYDVRPDASFVGYAGMGF